MRSIRERRWRALIGARLKRLRLERGWTQKDVGERLGISKPAVSQYEKERRTPDAEKLGKLAETFEVSVDYLLGRTEVRGPVKTTATSRSDGYDEELPPEAVKFLKEFEALMRIKYGHKKGPGKAD